MLGGIATYDPSMSQGPSKLCRLCGSPGELSFEHIPPKRCFNNRLQQATSLRLMARGYKNIKQKYRRGMGEASLCSQCNSWTGNTYGPAFAAFAGQAMQYLDRGVRGSQLYLPFQCMPLRVAKQLLTMAVAMWHPEMLQVPRYDAIRGLVRVPRSRPDDFPLRLYVYLMPDGSPRLNGLGTPMFIGPSRTPITMCYFEAALPPLGYVMLSTGADSEAVAHRLGLCDITHFLTKRDDLELRTEFLGLSCLIPDEGVTLTYRNASMV